MLGPLPLLTESAHHRLFVHRSGLKVGDRILDSILGKVTVIGHYPSGIVTCASAGGLVSHLTNHPNLLTDPLTDPPWRDSYQVERPSPDSFLAVPLHMVRVGCACAATFMRPDLAYSTAADWANRLNAGEAMDLGWLAYNPENVHLNRLCDWAVVCLRDFTCAPAKAVVQEINPRLQAAARAVADAALLARYEAMQRGEVQDPKSKHFCARLSVAEMTRAKELWSIALRTKIDESRRVAREKDRLQVVVAIDPEDL